MIDYIGDSVGLRGREEWLLSVHEDGARTLRAHCEMWDTELERDVVHTVSSGFLPRRTFISQRMATRFQGEGWFVFDDDTVSSSQLLADIGMHSASTPLPKQPQFFVPHSVCADAWIVPAYDLGRGGTQLLCGGWRSSPKANGSTGPVVEQMDPVKVTLLAEESTRVPAGTFDTLHFVVEQREGQRDEIWTSGPDYLLVQLRCDLLDSWYQLADLQTGDGASLAPAQPPGS